MAMYQSEWILLRTLWLQAMCYRAQFASFRTAFGMQEQRTVLWSFEKTIDTVGCCFTLARYAAIAAHAVNYIASLGVANCPAPLVVERT